MATPEQTRALFVAVMERTVATQASPEFYNTLVNNCTTNLRDHVNAATPAGLPWGWGVLLPRLSDAHALEHGLLGTTLDLDAARARYRVDQRIREVLVESGGAFSRRIREPGRHWGATDRRTP